jgi:DHA1 family tetracycline resistance protein-like MFS transporter
MLGAAFGLGFIFGPFLGGKLADPNFISWFNASTPFLFAGILAFVNLISIYFFFTETNSHIDPYRKIDFFSSVKNIIKARKLLEIRHLLLVSFLFNAGFSFFTSFFNVFLTTKFHFDAPHIGNFFGYIGLCVIFTQLVIVRFVSKKYKDVQILRYAYIVAGLAVVLYLIPKVSWWIFVIAPIFAIANGLQQANFGALFSKRIDPKQRGEIMGINTSVNSLGQAIPPLLAGGIASLLAPWAPVFIASIVIIIAGIIFILTEKR